MESSLDSITNGLASPVYLQALETEVLLSDYLEPGIEADSLTGHEALDIRFDHATQTAWLTAGKELPPLSILHLYAGNQRTDLALFRSIKQRMDFIFDPGEKEYKTVEMAGDMNAWNPANTLFKRDGNVWKSELYLIPGNYGYQMELDGVRQLDPNNAEQISNGMGGYNSLWVVEGIPENEMPLISLDAFDKRSISVKTQNADKLTVLWNNTSLSAISGDDHFEIAIPEKAFHTGRSYLRIWAQNDKAASNYSLVPLDQGKVVTDYGQLNRQDPHTNIMYFIMVDRFHNGTKENDSQIRDDSIHPRANFLGGDLKGILDKVEEGYFDSLGINNLWLSPIVRNPEGAYGYYHKGGVTSKFSAYHGYWPISFTRISSHFGTEQDLQKLVKSAHDREYNMTLDFVANHVHELHPVYQANKDNGWATELYLPDGSLNTEKWDEHRLTTWFDVFLPTLNLEKQEITEMLSDSAVYWLDQYAFDAFRHDATKHIPENFWRTLTRKVKDYENRTGKSVLQLGETYGTPELISSYISSGMLDGQFDFNVYDAISNCLAKTSTGFELVAERLRQSQEYYGTNHVMGNISGNQDRARFMALATGDVRADEDTKLAGWTRDIQTRDDTGFRKVAMLHAFNFTIPGIPVIYYGDEIGLTGGNDPDNRRMMYFDKWNSNEKALFDTVSKLARWRKSKLAFLYGDLQIMHSEFDALVFSRRYFDDMAIVLFNHSELAKDLLVPIQAEMSSENWIPFSGSTVEFTDDQHMRVHMAPYSFEILINESIQK